MTRQHATPSFLSGSFHLKLALGIIILIWVHTRSALYAQPEDLSQVWPAFWIEPATGTSKDYAVTYFRKRFDLDRVPDTLKVHTSGDQIYQLFVNGQFVTRGPQTGDLRHWHYETTDVAPFLQPGKNVIAAAVLNYGSHPPDARLTVQTGFILAADDRQNRYLNTGHSWKAKQSKAYAPNRVDASQVQGYYGGGSREILNASLHIWGWEKTTYDDSHWEDARQVERAFARTCKWASRWKLTPRTLPHEELRLERFRSVRKVENAHAPEHFPAEPAVISIPPKTKASILLDFGMVTTAYPIMTVSGGRDASIKITYSEAGYIGPVGDRNKENRSEVAGKTFTGYFDKYLPDGESDRIYKPFWWRTFRYVLLDIETDGQELVIHDFTSEYSAYPFHVHADFQITSDAIDPDLVQQILATGVRTVQLCSHETFVDCPYYEESQFQGDTRIQALVSYLNFGDGRLGNNAIRQFAWSLNNEGFQSARYPTNSLYYIPNYSLYWIGMLHDYMMHFDDHAFIRSMLPVGRSILQYFFSLQRHDGTLRKPDYHNFVDWSFSQGEPPFDANGYSAIVDLHFLMALQWAAELEEYAGDQQLADKYSDVIINLQDVIRKTYWSEQTGMFSDTPDASAYSQHTNCLAILTGISTGAEAKRVMRKVMEGQDMTRATLYWSFYVFEAMHQAGLGSEYINHLAIWEEALAAGCTTWPETGLQSRSECHGWGASPNIHFYKLVAGIQSTGPGFREVLIRPDLDTHRSLSATIPHHAGQIRLDAKREADDGVYATITLPEDVHGEFVWRGTTAKLKPGANEVEMKNEK